MCRTAEEIRSSDYTCITLDEYITHRKKQVNGDKESLAYFDVLRAEAEIQNRVITIQTKEDMDIQFKKASKDRTQMKRGLTAVTKGLKDHIEECKKKPTVTELIQEKPLKFWFWVTAINVAYFFVFHLIGGMVGFEQWLLAIISKITGVPIPAP